MDRNLARDAIAKACRKLAEGQETRLDRGVVSSAFPPGIDERPVEDQIRDFLSDTGISVSCVPTASGDFLVRRRREEAPAAPLPPAGRAPERKAPAAPKRKPPAAASKKPPAAKAAKRPAKVPAKPKPKARKSRGR